MRYTWTAAFAFVIWLSAVLLMGSDRLPNPELFFSYIMGLTILLAYIGFRSA